MFLGDIPLLKCYKMCFDFCDFAVSGNFSRDLNNDGLVSLTTTKIDIMPSPRPVAGSSHAQGLGARNSFKSFLSSSKKMKQIR